MPLMEGYPWDDLCKTLHGGQRKARVQNGKLLSCSVVPFECVTFAIFCTYLSPVYHSTVQYSILSKVSTPSVGCTNVTDDREMDLR